MDSHAGASAKRVKRTRLPGRWRHVIAKEPSGESVADPSRAGPGLGPGVSGRAAIDAPADDAPSLETEAFDPISSRSSVGGS